MITSTTGTTTTTTEITTAAAEITTTMDIGAIRTNQQVQESGNRNNTGNDQLKICGINICGLKFKLNNGVSVII